MPDAYIIEMAASGLKKSDFYVSIKGNILTVSFLHKDNENKKNCIVCRSLTIAVLREILLCREMLMLIF